MKKLQVLLLTICTIIVLPFVQLWNFMRSHITWYLIKQFIWTAITGTIASISVCVAMAAAFEGLIVISLMAFWCYICFGSMAMCDYKYFIWRYL